MIVRVEVNNLRELFRVAGANISDLAASMDVAQPTISCKVNGLRSWYEDELQYLVAALNKPGTLRKEVGFPTVVKLIGAKNIKVRGTLADKEV